MKTDSQSLLIIDAFVDSELQRNSEEHQVFITPHKTYELNTDRQTHKQTQPTTLHCRRAILTFVRIMLLALFTSSQTSILSYPEYTLICRIHNPELNSKTILLRVPLCYDGHSLMTKQTLTTVVWGPLTAITYTTVHWACLYCQRVDGNLSYCKTQPAVRQSFELLLLLLL